MGLVLLLIPLYIAYVMGLRGARRFFVVAGRMALLVILYGGVVSLLMTWNNWMMNIFAGLVMAVGGALLTIKHARLNAARLIVPVTVGMLVPAFIVGVYVCFLVLGLKNPLEARFFIPVMGLLCGCNISLNAHGLHIYYMGLHHHNRLYYYLLGNGSTHREAINYFMKRSFQAALNPLMKRMSMVVMTTAPVVMLSLVMGGTSVVTAVAMQLLLFVMVVSVSFISLYITLLIGRHYSFDAYEKLRSVSAVAATTDAPVPTSDSSASLSTPPHNDAENLPQE